MCHKNVYEPVLVSFACNIQIWLCFWGAVEQFATRVLLDFFRQIRVAGAVWHCQATTEAVSARVMVMRGKFNFSATLTTLERVNTADFGGTVKRIVIND